MSRLDRGAIALAWVTLVAAGVLTACSDSSSTTPTGGAGPAAADRAAARHVGNLETLADGVTLAPGTYAAAFAGSAGDATWATMSVPAGFANGSGWVMAGDGALHERALQLWTVDQVNTNPCGATRQRDVGPTATDLVRALERLRVRRPTAAVRAAVDGHSGWYLEMSVPSDLHACGHGQLYGSLDTWWADDLESKQGQVPGEVDHLWVVDVEGTRFVVDAVHESGATAEQVAELDDVARSVRFSGPGLGADTRRRR